MIYIMWLPPSVIPARNISLRRQHSTGDKTRRWTRVPFHVIVDYWLCGDTSSNVNKLTLLNALKELKTTEDRFQYALREKIVSSLWGG